MIDPLILRVQNGDYLANRPPLDHFAFIIILNPFDYFQHSLGVNTVY